MKAAELLRCGFALAVGWHGQLIAVFPDVDVVAVVTAHKFVRFGDVICGVSAAVKSELVLPPNPIDAERLVNAINETADHWTLISECALHGLIRPLSRARHAQRQRVRGASTDP